MGLADFKARLLLFFAGKLRQWANSIDENVPSTARRPGSVAKERERQPVTEFGADDDALDSEPAAQPATPVAGGPPQHWIDLVRDRAPELLSLTRGYSSEEGPLPEDHIHTYRSETDDEVKMPGQRVAGVPGKEDVVRKSEPEPSPAKKVVDKRNARTRGKSFLPRLKPLPLKPLSEPSRFLPTSMQDRDRRTEPAKPAEPIRIFHRDEKAAAPSNQSTRGAVNKEDQVVTRELTRQPTPQKPRSDEPPVIYRTPKTERTIGSVAKSQSPAEVDITQKSEVQKSSFKVIRKRQFGPRRYLQAILSMTRRTLRRAARAEGQPSHASTSVNLSVNSSSTHSSSTHSSPSSNVVSFTASSKVQRPVKPETSSTSIQQSEKKAVSVIYPVLKAPEAATRQVSPPIRSRAQIKDVKTVLPQPARAAFPRQANRSASISNARIQDAFVNIPALMDEETMSRASSVHLADLRPGKNQWPDLPSATDTEVADELAAHQRDLNRMRRLKQEQRGTPWNE